MLSVSFFVTNSIGFQIDRKGQTIVREKKDVVVVVTIINMMKKKSPVDSLNKF